MNKFFNDLKQSSEKIKKEYFLDEITKIINNFSDCINQKISDDIYVEGSNKHNKKSAFNFIQYQNKNYNTKTTRYFLEKLFTNKDGEFSPRKKINNILGVSRKYNAIVELFNDVLNFTYNSIEKQAQNVGRFFKNENISEDTIRKYLREAKKAVDVLLEKGFHNEQDSLVDAVVQLVKADVNATEEEKNQIKQQLDAIKNPQAPAQPAPPQPGQPVPAPAQPQVPLLPNQQIPAQMQMPILPAPPQPGQPAPDAQATPEAPAAPAAPAQPVAQPVPMQPVMAQPGQMVPIDPMTGQPVMPAPAAPAAPVAQPAPDVQGDTAPADENIEDEEIEGADDDEEIEDDEELGDDEDVGDGENDEDLDDEDLGDEDEGDEDLDDEEIGDEEIDDEDVEGDENLDDGGDLDEEESEEESEDEESKDETTEEIGDEEVDSEIDTDSVEDEDVKDTPSAPAQPAQPTQPAAQPAQPVPMQPVMAQPGQVAPMVQPAVQPAPPVMPAGTDSGEQSVEIPPGIKNPVIKIKQDQDSISLKIMSKDNINGQQEALAAYNKLKDYLAIKVNPSTSLFCKNLIENCLPEFGDELYESNRNFVWKVLPTIFYRIFSETKDAKNVLNNFFKYHEARKNRYSSSENEHLKEIKFYLNEIASQQNFISRKFAKLGIGFNKIHKENSPEAFFTIRRMINIYKCFDFTENTYKDKKYEVIEKALLFPFLDTMYENDEMTKAKKIVEYRNLFNETLDKSSTGFESTLVTLSLLPKTNPTVLNNGTLPDMINAYFDWSTLSDQVVNQPKVEKIKTVELNKKVNMNNLFNRYVVPKMLNLMTEGYNPLGFKVKKIKCEALHINTLIHMGLALGLISKEEKNKMTKNI